MFLGALLCTQFLWPLRTLHLDHNRLATLTPHVGLLTALTDLTLHANRLTTLPEEIGRLADYLRKVGARDSHVFRLEAQVKELVQ